MRSTGVAAQMAFTDKQSFGTRIDVTINGLMRLRAFTASTITAV